MAQGVADDVIARTYVAETSLKDGQWKRAIEQYQWLRQKQPENVVVLNNLAWAYQQTKDPPGAGNRRARVQAETR